MPENIIVPFAGDQQPVEPAVSSIPPITSSPRIQSLDVLRGIAILGGLLIGIWVFGGFSVNKQAYLQLHPHGLNYRMYATFVLLLEGKMLGLISLVFGAGMVLFMSGRGITNRLPLADIFIRRQMWLIIFGLINALVFLSTNDLLFHLGVLGILVFPFVRLSHRGLLIAAVVTTLIFSGKHYWNYSDDQKLYNKYLAATTIEKKIEKDSLNKRKQDSITRARGGVIAASAPKKDTLTKQQQQDKGAWEGMVKNMKYDPKKDEGNIKSMRAGEFGKIWNHLLPGIQAKEAMWTYRTGIWEIASLLFLGMALFKAGFFNNRLPVTQYLLIVVLGFAAGISLGLFRMYYSTAALIDYTKYISRYWYPSNLFYPFEKICLVAAYASLVMLLLRSRAFHVLSKALSCVGVMALTNYLLQSLICTLFFTGYGMGYFARLSQTELYIVVAEIWVVQIVFSVLWLRRFRYGPAEWLLRSLSYGTSLSIKLPRHENLANTSPAIS